MTPCVYLMSCGSSREIETDVSFQDHILFFNSRLDQYRHTAQLTGHL
jgi:hypothetical protein